MITVKLGEISNITMGQSPKSCFYNSDGNGLPFLQGRTTFGRIFPSFDTWTTKWNKEAPKNSLLFTVRAPVGDVNVTKERIAIGRGIASLEPKLVTLEYLYYVLISNKKSFLSKSNGAVYDAINIDTLASTSVLIHENQDQSKVVSILSKYDKAIESNSEQIRLLESMAEQKYKQNVIKLSPFNRNTNQSHNDYANDWKKMVLSEVLEKSFNGGWGEDNPVGKKYFESNVIRGTDINDIENGSFNDVPNRFHAENEVDSKQLVNNDIVLELSNGNIDNIGRSLFVDNYVLNKFSHVMCASFCKVLRSKNRRYALALAFEIKYLQNTKLLSFYKNTGTNGINNFNFKRFLKQEITIPPSLVLEDIQSFYSLANSLREENINLLKQMNMLLPRLMSGKLDISGKEII